MPQSIVSTGAWSSVFDWPLIGLHAILTPDNKVLTYGTDEKGIQGGQFIYDVWDFSTNTHYTLPNTTKTDLFCSVSAHVPLTGEVLIGGGDARYGNFNNRGISDVNSYDPTSMSLSASITGDMAYARWYPTAVTLANGKILMLGGKDLGGNGVGMPELFTPDSGWKSLTGGYSREIANNWWYPRAFLNSDGDVIVFGTTSRAAGNYAVQVMDPSGNGSVETIGVLPFKTAIGMPAILYEPDKVLVLALDGSAWIMDISGDKPTYTRTGDVGGDRIWSNMVLLADGSVMISGGSGVDTAVSRDLIDPSYSVAIWNPLTGQWAEGADAHLARLYHSTTLLLPDATVLSLGGGAPGPLTNTNGEIYTPGYLFDENGNLAVRPVITDAPVTLDQGATFTIEVGDASDVSRVTLIKAGSVTHSLNMTTVRIEMDFTVGPGNTLQMTLPDNSNSVTPGNWLLFVFNDKGTPSVAATIEVGLGGEYYSDVLSNFVTLNGSAVVDDATGSILLTPDSTYKSGSVMSNERVDLTHDFELTFGAYFGTKDAAGADGIAFVLHNDPFGADASGAGGGGFGTLGVRSGIGIEFDTWRNPIGDIAQDHTNFYDTDGPRWSQNITSPVALDNLENGAWHDIVVHWDASTETLSYWVDGKLAGELQQDIAEKYLGGSTQAYFGLSASTGGASNEQQVKLVSFDGQFSSDPTSGSHIDPLELAGKITINGNAAYSQRTGVVTLTPDVTQAVGGMTLNERIDLTSDFQISMQFKISANDAGADGIALVLHDDPRGTAALGLGGGYLGLTGIQKGLGIELDTWRNAAFNGEIYDDHTNFIDTDTTGARNVTNPFSLGNIEDGAWHSLTLKWEAHTETLQYWMDGNLVGKLSGDLVNDYFGGQSSVYFGLTGATGGAANLQQVRLLDIDATMDTSNPQPAFCSCSTMAPLLTFAGNTQYDDASKVYTLTSTGYSASSVTFKEKVSLDDSFYMSFDLKLGANDRGGDGMAFVLHNDPQGATAVGALGGKLGAGGLADGLGIEFDTYNNRPFKGDINDDHTNFFDTDLGPGTGNLSKAVSLGNVEDNAWHNVQVAWDADTQTLSYWFDKKFMGEISGDVIDQYLGGSHTAYLGITGGTGGATNVQQVRFDTMWGLCDDVNPLNFDLQV